MSTDMRASRDAVNKLWRNRFMGLIFLAILFATPSMKFIPPTTYGFVLISALVGLSMNVLVGYAGQISLAHAALYGSAAFVIGRLISAGAPWGIAMIGAALFTSAVALLIGFPALRIRGLNLAIATLGFQFAMQRVFFRLTFFGGTAGVNVPPPAFSKNSDFFNPAVHPEHFLYIILATIVFVFLLDRNLTRSRAGRAFFALRQDEQVAASFGIPVARYKLLAFVISGFYAGLAGALFGTMIQTVTNESFDYLFSISFLVFAVLGGLGSRIGTAFGGASPAILQRALQNLRYTGQMIGGMLLVITLLRYPGGAAEQGRELLHLGSTFRKRGVRWLLAFLGVAAGAIAAGFAGQFVFGVVVNFVAGLFSHYRLTVFPRILAFLAVAAVGFQIGVVRLLGVAGVATRTREDDDTGTSIVQADRLALASTISFKRAVPVRRAQGALLEVDDVSIRFGGVRALDGVSMEVREGELIGIMGPNGSGKTTLLNNISGFLSPNSGDIRFQGRSILKMPAHERAALGLGRTFQNVGLVKQETVFDNFLISQHLVCKYGSLEGLARTGGVLAEERRLRQRAHAAISMLGLEDIAGTQVRALPHGRAKLVELGCALVTGPELLLLDEPAAGVSPQEADALGETLKAIAKHFGVTILMIEHHVPLMLSTCDYIYVLNFGRMLTHGEPEEVARHPDVIAAYLGSAGREPSLAPA